MQAVALCSECWYRTCPRLISKPIITLSTINSLGAFDLTVPVPFLLPRTVNLLYIVALAAS